MISETAFFINRQWGRLSPSADTAFTFYAPQARAGIVAAQACSHVWSPLPFSLRKVDLPKAKTEGVNRVFFILRGCFFHILHASSRRGSYFARSGKVSKALFWSVMEGRSGGKFFRLTLCCEFQAVPFCLSDK